MLLIIQPHDMKLNLPSIILAKLAQRGTIMDSDLRGSPERLEKVCMEHGYALHPSVIDFEVAFDGLAMPDQGA